MLSITVAKSVSTLLRSFTLPLLAVAIVLGMLSNTAEAQLARVGPTDKANGFPLWYQDKDGVALDLCLPDQAELSNGICVLFAADIPNPDAPIVFPSNFPDEAFWFLANATLDVPGGRAVLVMGVEAAFSLNVAPGDQITFSRLRILFDAAEPGHYRVTTPYGVREFDVDTPGKRAVFSTEDIGIGAPGDFSGALNGSIGPFLHASDSAGGAPKAPFLFDGHQYLADPGATTAVTGSPLGAAYNVFRIEGPIVEGVTPPKFETDQFTLNGKIHTASIPSPMHVVRATYGRDANGLGHVDAFAVGAAGIGNATPTLTLSGPGLTTTAMSRNGENFYGQAVFDQGRPNVITVTNTADAPPTPFDYPVSDEITITEASYDAANGSLHIAANSSDHKAPPKLVYQGTQLAPGSDPWTGSITLTGVDVAPATVTVESTYTGRTTVPVTISQGNGLPPSPSDVPSATSDTATTTGVTPVIIQILDNDNPNSGVTSRLITSPGSGTAELLSDGTVRYTAQVGFVGDDTFQYVNTKNGVDSNAATVTVTVLAGNNPPIARNDTAIAVAGSSAISVKVLANDSDPDAGDSLDTASVTIASSPTGGSASPDGTGAITYTPPGTAGTYTFTYTVADNHGAVSQAATVTVTVNASEVIAVSKANYKTGGSEWDIAGTSTIFGPGNRMTVDLMRAGVKIATVGTADVDNLGAWRLRPKGSSAIARVGDTLKITSSQKTVLNNVAIRIN